MNGGLPPFMSMFSEDTRRRQSQAPVGVALNPQNAANPTFMAGRADTNRDPHGQHLSVTGMPLSPPLGYSARTGPPVTISPRMLIRIPPQIEEMSENGKMAKPQNTELTPHPKELLEAHRQMALFSQMQMNLAQMNMAQRIPCLPLRMGAGMAPITPRPLAPLMPRPSVGEILSLDFLQHQEQQQEQKQPQGQQLATPQQGQLDIALRQQNDLFARRLQQFAQTHHATFQAISQQRYAALVAASSPSLNQIEHSPGESGNELTQQGFAAFDAASPSLNRVEHSFGKSRKDAMPLASQNRVEHSFDKNSNETVALQALPRQRFAALDDASLSQDRVKKSLEKRSEETAASSACILPRTPFGSIAYPPKKRQASLPQKTAPRELPPICIQLPAKKHLHVTPVMRLATAAGPAGLHGENTGRWTDHEHRLFLKSLGLFGNDARKIHSLVKSRTPVQIRTHAQKYFHNLAKAAVKPGASHVSHVNNESTFEETMRRKYIGIDNVNAGSKTIPRRNVIAEETNLISGDALRPTAGAAKKNQSASINDAAFQGKVEFIATPSTQYIHTTQETTHEAKKLSGKDKTKGTKLSKNIGRKEMPSNEDNANGVARDAEEKSPDDPLHHRLLSIDTLKNDTSGDAEEKSPRQPHHHHRHLNEDTLKMIKSHLEANRGEHLDEDAVVAQTLRMERVKRSSVNHDPCELSDEDDNDTARQQAHQNAEDYALALDIYKKVIADTRKENSGAVLDNKTLDWVRKAMGLHRHSNSGESSAANQVPESGEEAELQGSEPRRRTRGTARMIRVKKQEQRAVIDRMRLDALLLAVAGLEEEFGPFSENKSRKRKRQQSGTRTATPASQNFGKRHRLIGGTRNVNALNEKCKKRKQSKGKPKLGQGDTVDITKRKQVSLSSITPNISLVPTAPIFSERRGQRQMHGLATLAQRFVQIVTTSGSQEIDLQDVVDLLGIRKRRIYDVVNILDGAGVVASTRHRNKYRWIPKVDCSHDLKQLVEEKRQLEYEEKCLDAWIKLQTLRMKAMRRKYSGNENDQNGDSHNSLEGAIVDEADHESDNPFRLSVDHRKEGQSNSGDGDGKARVRKSLRKRTPRKIDQESIATSSHASLSCVKARDGGAARGQVRKGPTLDDETRARKRPRREADEKTTQEGTADIAKMNGVSSSPFKSNRSLDMSEPLFSRIGQSTKLHGLATLAQRFRMMMMATGKHVIDLCDAVEYLKIPRRRIYDVVCVLEGAGLMERITPRTEKTLASKYRWIHSRDSSRDLEELHEEGGQLDDWIEELTRRRRVESVETHVESQLLAPFLKEGSTTMAIASAQMSILHLPHELEKKPTNGHCTFMIVSTSKTSGRCMLPKAFILDKDGDNVIMHHLPLMPPQTL